MLGLFKVIEFLDPKRVKARSIANEGVEGIFYLPPLNRQATSAIQTATRFYGIMDEVSGQGALLVAIDDDFDGKFDYDLKANDFKTYTLSLGSHAHSAGEALISPAGYVTGTTGGSIPETV